ncbi:DUF4411 family protein [Bdellovibrio sp. HCB290]|uniref:DUF4411 family protein n=1 Tax=Bdellovibrio sp. HCB290 TaxID=3394356 RepID=UPI0039B5E6BE
MSTIYCVDASSILYMQWTYPIDVFEQIWLKFEEDVNSGILITSEVVVEELGKKGDHASEFSKKLGGFGHKIDAQTLVHAATILTKVPHLIDAQNSNPQADPYLIGLSMTKNATIVTQERSAPNAKKAKMPDVCAHFGVPCIDLLTLARARNWKF